jgi:hypothetical protein
VVFSTNPRSRTSDRRNFRSRHFSLPFPAMRSFPWRPFPFRRGNGKETIGPIEVPIHGFLANPIPVGMVTPARPYAEAAQGAGGPVEVPNSCTSVSKDPDARSIAGALPWHRERGASPTTPSAFRQHDPPTVLPEHTAVEAKARKSPARRSRTMRSRPRRPAGAAGLKARCLATPEASPQRYLRRRPPSSDC